MRARSKCRRKIELQARDIELLRGLFESRVMSTAHIATIYFNDRYEMARKRLQKLAAAGLVTRYAAIELRTPPFVLTPAGLSELEARGVPGEYPAVGSSAERRTRVSPLTLRHELEVMDVKASFVGAARGAGVQVAECTTWPLLNQFKTARGRVVKPDAHIRIVEPQHDGITREHSFFVEVDRSTESQSVLIERVRDYLDFRRTSSLDARNADTQTPDRGNSFRVLFVLKTAKRRGSTIERLLQHPPAIQRLIWLATAEDVMRDPFGKIWITPADYRLAFSHQSGDAGHRAHESEYKRNARRDEFIEQMVTKRTLLS